MRHRGYVADLNNRHRNNTFELMKSAIRYNDWFGNVAIFTVVIWVIALIVPEPHDKLLHVIADIGFVVGFITLMASLLNYYGYVLKRKKRYIYDVRYRYDGKDGKSFRFQFNHRRSSPVWGHHEFKSQMGMDKELNKPQYKDKLSNGSLHVEHIIYMGSEYIIE